MLRRHLTAFAVPEQLAQYGVFRGLHEQLGAVAANRETLAAVELGPVERLGADSEEIDLSQDLHIEDVPRSDSSQVLSECFDVNFEVGAQLASQGRRQTRVHLHDEINVVGGARLALHRAGETAAEKIRDPEPFECRPHEECDIERRRFRLRHRARVRKAAVPPGAHKGERPDAPSPLRRRRQDGADGFPPPPARVRRAKVPPRLPCAQRATARQACDDTGSVAPRRCRRARREFNSPSNRPQRFMKATQNALPSRRHRSLSICPWGTPRTDLA